MPTSSQHISTFHPRPRITSTVSEMTVPIRTTRSARNSYANLNRTPSRLSTKSSSSRRENAFMDHERKVPKMKCSRPVLIASLGVLAFLIISAMVLVIALPLILTRANSSTTSITTITTTTTTTTTTALNCIFPYALGLSGYCVNTLLDYNNCGAVGNSCSVPNTSCSAGACSNVPMVQLANSTSIWTGGVNGSADDLLFNVTLPFPITLYSTTTNQIQVTSNGVLCLSYCSNTWIDGTLPRSSFGATVFPYWDDLFIYSKTWQGIYFASQGNAPSRTLTFEYYTSRYGLPDQFDHFQVVFSESSPHIVQFIYFNVYNNGSTATVGVQASGTGSSIQYSSNQANSIQANLILTFNTNLTSYTNSSIG